jgi:hypothetical protein
MEKLTKFQMGNNFNHPINVPFGLSSFVKGSNFKQDIMEGNRNFRIYSPFAFEKKN